MFYYYLDSFDHSRFPLHYTTTPRASHRPSWSCRLPHLVYSLCCGRALRLLAAKYCCHGYWPLNLWNFCQGIAFSLSMGLLGPLSLSLSLLRPLKSMPLLASGCGTEACSALSSRPVTKAARGRKGIKLIYTRDKGRMMG